MEPALQALELGQQPAVTVDHAEATHAEAAGQEAEVERLDRDRAAGLSLQLPDRQLPDEHRQGDDHGRAQDEDDDHDHEQPAAETGVHGLKDAKVRAPPRVACSSADQAGILPAMTTPAIDLDSLRRGARLAGFDWSDAELEEIRPQVENALRLLRALEAIPLREDAEPTTLYRTV